MAKTPVELSEKGFEEYVEEHLLKSGYVKGNPNDYNKAIKPPNLFGQSHTNLVK